MRLLVVFLLLLPMPACKCRRVVKQTRRPLCGVFLVPPRAREVAPFPGCDTERDVSPDAPEGERVPQNKAPAGPALIPDPCPGGT